MTLEDQLRNAQPAFDAMLERAESRSASATDLELNDRATHRRAFASAAAVVVTAAIVVAGFVVAGRRTSTGPDGSARNTSTTDAPVPVPRPGTLSFESGRPTLELVGHVRIPITHLGRYVWTGHLIAAPASVLSFHGYPDSGSDDHRIDGTAAIANYRYTWIGTFPKGNLIAERVTFRVDSYRSPAAVELLGGSISGAPTTTSTRASG